MNNYTEYVLIHEFLCPGDIIDKFELEDNMYKADWNSLMLVIHKLESIDLFPGNIKIEVGPTNFAKAVFQQKAMKEEGNTKIEAAYNLVVHLIGWYNENVKGLYTLAKYMNFEYSSIRGAFRDVNNVLPSHITENNQGDFYDELLFNQSWDWLIPVCKKVFKDSNYQDYADVKYQLTRLDLEACYKACINYVSQFKE